MIENRKFIRLCAPLLVEYKIIKKHKRQRLQRGIIKNISVGGLSLSVNDEMRHGELLQLHIQIPHFEEPVRVIGDVVWHSSQKSRENGEIERHSGVRFREVNPSDLNKILDYVYSMAIG